MFRRVNTFMKVDMEDGEAMTLDLKAKTFYDGKVKFEIEFDFGKIEGFDYEGEDSDMFDEMINEMTVLAKMKMMEAGPIVVEEQIEVRS